MYNFKSRIRYSEINAQGFLSMEALMNYFQDCSTFQSEDAEIGLDYLGQRDAAWVVNSWQVDVTRYPKLGENVIIGTIPYEIKGFIGCRNFYMDSSVWALINIKSGGPIRVTPKMIEGYPLGEKLPMEYLSRKISFPKEVETRSLQEIVIQPYHLDTNMHVNNNRYISMSDECIRALREDDYRYVTKRLRAEYRMQAHLNDVIYPVCYTRREQNDVIYTVSLNDKDGKPYCIVEVTKSKIPSNGKEE